MDIPTNHIKDILAPKMPTKYLRDFFAEKDIETQIWDLVDNDGCPHLISNVVVIEHIAIAPAAEIAGIEKVLRQIDFANGDVNHFFKHLAGALINRSAA